MQARCAASLQASRSRCCSRHNPSCIECAVACSPKSDKVQRDMRSVMYVLNEYVHAHCQKGFCSCCWGWYDETTHTTDLI